MQDRLEALLAAKKAHGEALARSIPAGHRCGPVTVTQAEWEAMEIASLKEKAARSALVPTEQDAINLMHECYQRLRELGWNNAIYCPKDGSEFDAIEAGSTGIHCCHYSGEWPDGHWWVADHGDLWPSRPILYRVTEKELAERAAARERTKAFVQEQRAASAGRNAKRQDPQGLGPQDEHAVPNDSEGDAHTPQQSSSKEAAAPNKCGGANE